MERAPTSEYPVILSYSGDKPILPAAPHRGVGMDMGQVLLQSWKQKLNTHMNWMWRLEGLEPLLWRF